MEKTIEDKENFLFNRKEVKIIVKAEKNPSYKEAENSISEQFKTNKENIVIKHVKGKFGRNTFLISAFIYKTAEDKEKFEPKKKQEEKKSEEKQEETKPAEEEPTQPQPKPEQAEEKKEEIKPEEKKPTEEETKDLKTE